MRYDALNRLIAVTDPTGHETQYTYDDRDNLIALKDANGNTTHFSYDRNNRLLKETRPMGQETRYAYDGAGNLISKTDAKGQITKYEYDGAGKLTRAMYFAAENNTEPVKTVTFTYDRVGNILSYDDGITSGQYTYDKAYRKVSETVDYGPFQKEISYAYYKNGMKKSFTGPDNITYEYAYDAANLLKEIKIPGQGSITYSSYKWNRPGLVTLPGGTTREYDYDPLMRVTPIKSTAQNGNILMNYRYTYDKMDNILKKDTEHGTYSYGYDDLYRLTSADSPSFDPERFTYDPVGNRLTSADVKGKWQYNSNNELLSYNGVQFKYDANGSTTERLQQGQTTTYTYNVENRLARVEDGKADILASYYYDPFGRRLWKEVGGKKTYFLYSEEGLIGEYLEGGTEQKIYAYKPNSTWTTDPLFMKQGDDYFFYHNDHLGTQHKMISLDGEKVWADKHMSFGKTEIELQKVQNNLRLPGQYFDVESGLHYNCHRYYNSNLGRYIKIDPIGFNGGFNLYMYCSDNPVNFIDPKGTQGYGPLYFERWPTNKLVEPIGFLAIFLYVPLYAFVELTSLICIKQQELSERFLEELKC